MYSGTNFSYDYGRHVVFNGTEFFYPKTPIEMAENIPPGANIVTEASLVSYGTGEDYNKVLEIWKKNNVKVMKIGTRAVKNWRLDHNEVEKYTDNEYDTKKKKKKKKTYDEEDAKILHEIAYTTDYRCGIFKPKTVLNLEITDEEVERWKFKESWHRLIRISRENNYEEEKDFLTANWFKDSAANCQVYIIAKFLKSRNITDRKSFDDIVGLFALSGRSWPRGTFNYHQLKSEIPDVEERKSKELRNKHSREMRKTSRKIFHYVMNDRDDRNRLLKRFK